MRFVLGLMIFVVACGDSDPVEVISSTLTGSVDGKSLSAIYGVANTLDSGTVSIAAGTGKLDCGSQMSNNPPGSGIYINLQIPEAIVGVPSEHFFQFFTIAGGELDSRGSNSGTAEVTAVSEESIALTVAYDEVFDDASYQASGSFEVVLCN